MYSKVIACLVLIIAFQSNLLAQIPSNDIVSRRIIEERPLLEYPPIREADLFWEKRISRLIDTRQKRNLPFVSPKAPLFELMRRGAENGELTLYRDADFNDKVESFDGIFFTIDTLIEMQEDPYIENIRVYQNDVGFEQIQKYRLNELWYFDENTSSMRVQIIGLAPIITVIDDFGNPRYEKPLFWIHFPSSRKYFAKQKVPNDFNDAVAMSWDDLLQIRMFDSHITKQSNIRDNRLQDIYSGVELLQEAEKIKEEIRNFEHDLWSY